MIKIEIHDEAVTRALNEVAKRTSNMGPILRVLGEGIQKRIKKRFETSTGPDGVRWEPNSPATLLAFIGAKGGIGKRGKVTKRGAAIGAAKKPLIGHSKDLSRQNHFNVSGNTLTVDNTMIYSGIQQFGGMAGRGRKVRIPARPFMPITSDESLYPDERDYILKTVTDYLRNVVS